LEVRERIAYIRGLLEGSDDLRADQKAHNLWENVLEVCDKLAESVVELQNEQDDLEEYVYGIDTDLCDLEDAVYGFSDQEDESGGDDAAQATELEEDLDEDDMVRAECPRCGEEVFFEESFLYDDDVEISCPDCGEALYRSTDVIVDENGHYPDYPDGEVYAVGPEGERPSP